MSLKFNDTTNLNGIIQLIERELLMDVGFISGNTTRMKQVTADVNLAWDSYLDIWLEHSGTWNPDDSNHTAQPIIKTNLVSGQRAYQFTLDQQDNLILDIYKVAILPSATATLYEEIEPIDQQTRTHAPDLVAESTVTGVPYEYDKTGNGIFLLPPSSYNATNGLKIYINREASYFTTSDTTKKPGCPGLHHNYFALKAAHDYARRYTLAPEASLRAAILTMEKNIKDYFGRRNRDDARVLRPKLTPYI